jgi:hypothetical protein
MIQLLEPRGYYHPEDMPRPEPFYEGPDYIRSANKGPRGKGYWHRPRHGQIMRDGHFEYCPGTDRGRYVVDQERPCYSTWCGLSFSFPVTATEPPKGEPICATCEGRYYGHLGIAGLSFRPRLHEPGVITGIRPRTCPGTGTLWTEEYEPHDAGTCAVCGFYVPIVREERGRLKVAGMRAHAPAKGLIQPCPRHVYGDLVFLGGLVVCRCQVPSE